jgi:hypothetical protein
LKISKWWLLLGAASLIFFTYISAQQKEEAGYEIISHKARLQLFPHSNALTCTDTLSLRLTNRNIEHFSLELLPVYTIEQITVEGKKTEVKRHQNQVQFDDAPSDSQFQIIIRYSGTLSFRSDFSLMTEDRAVLLEDEIFLHGPKSLQSARLSIIVPQDWEAIAVGKLASKDTLADSTRYVWEFNQRISMIGWICAGRYRSTTIIDSEKPISIHLFDQDSISASNCLSLTRDVLHYYDEKFSSYRFPKLAIVEVDDWLGGKNVLAIASPSIIMVKKAAFETKDVFNQVQSILPHEIAHQWWPMTVFIHDEDAAFLSEGMCDYSSMLYSQASSTASSRDSLKHHPFLRSLLMRVTKGEDLPLQQKADLRSLPTHYLKASYVHNMLRKIIGDSTFFQLYHEFARRFALVRIRMEDFEQLAQELSGKKLTWFFDQWVKKRGVPRLKLYNVKSISSDGRWVTKGRVRMLGYEKYTTFCEVGAITSAGIQKTPLWIGVDSTGTYRNDVPFEIVTAMKPLRAILDPDGDVLKLQKLPAKLDDLRDPSDGTMIVGTLQHSEHLMKLARNDSTEMDKVGWSVTIKTDTSITLADLQKERVILYGKASENRVVAEQQMKFPMAFRGDSVLVAAESIFDSTLSLIQIIDNPYIAQGLMVWIAPLSDIAKPELLPLDHSWVLVRGKEEISSGTWDVNDEESVVEIQ